MTIKKKYSSHSGIIKDKDPIRDFGNERPSFDFSYLQKGYDFSSCKQSIEKISFFNFISSIACCTWNMILKMPRTGAGSERIYESSFNVVIPVELKENKFISFRGSNIMRIIGFREGSIFYIVWIDPKGKVYKHG